MARAIFNEPNSIRGMEKRRKMVIEQEDQIQYLAYLATNIRNLKNDEFVVVCIKILKCWRKILDLILPDYDWKKHEEEEMKSTVATVTASFSFCDFLAAIFPKIATEMKEKPENGNIKCIVLDEDGCTVCELKPEKAN